MKKKATLVLTESRQRSYGICDDIDRGSIRASELESLIREVVDTDQLIPCLYFIELNVPISRKICRTARAKKSNRFKHILKDEFAQRQSRHAMRMAFGTAANSGQTTLICCAVALGQNLSSVHPRCADRAYYHRPLEPRAHDPETLGYRCYRNACGKRRGTGRTLDAAVSSWAWYEVADTTTARTALCYNYRSKTSDMLAAL
jgi:hypothetical protein